MNDSRAVYFDWIFFLLLQGVCCQVPYFHRYLSHLSHLFFWPLSTVRFWSKVLKFWSNMSLQVSSTCPSHETVSSFDPHRDMSDLWNFSMLRWLQHACVKSAFSPEFEFTSPEFEFIFSGVFGYVGFFCRVMTGVMTIFCRWSGWVVGSWLESWLCT